LRASLFQANSARCRSRQRLEGGLASCCIRVENVNDLQAFSAAGLSEPGTPRLTSPKNEPWGLRALAFVDPDGNLLRCLGPLTVDDLTSMCENGTTHMNRRSFAIGFGTLIASACRKPTPSATSAITPPRSMRADLTLITRDECVNSPDMFNNLDDALRRLGLGLDYQVVNLGKLPTTDSRMSYPTPTVLYRNHDLFGMPEPTPPYPEPS